MKKLNPFKPTDIGGYTLWLDGADASQLVLSGTNVTTWNDKSGFGNSCSNITGGTSITYPGTTVNGLNTVNFTAGCIRGAFNGASSNTGTDVTIFIVTSETAPNNNLRIFSLTGASSYRDDLADQMLVYGAVGGYLVGYYRGGTYSTTYSVTQNVPFLYTVTMTSGIGSQWFNGGSNATGSVPVSAFGVTNYNIGTQYLANQNYTGLMCEVIVYKNLLGTPQRQQVEAYLAQKWGLQANLPAGHPGRTGVIYPHNLQVYSLATGQATLKPYILPKFPLITTGLTNRWLFNEGTGTTFADSVGGQTGTLYGNPMWIFVNQRKGIYLANTTSGNNSATQYGTTTGGQPASVFATINWSLTVWIYPLTYLIEAADVFFGVGNYMDMYVGTSSGQLAMYCNLTPSYGLSASGTGVQKNVWSQITITCSNGAVTSYINGTLTTTGTYTTQTYVSSSITYIGAYQNTAFGVNMYLSDMRVYNRALSQTEINQICANTG